MNPEIIKALAEALNQYETSGLCPLRGACGLCDCGRDTMTPEQEAESYERALDRAKYGLEAIAPLIEEKAGK